MLPSIDFDYHKFLATNEITDVTADGLLTNKLVSVNLPVAKTIQEFRFGVGLVGAQLARPDGPLDRATHCLAPHLDCFAIRPLPAKGGERLRKCREHLRRRGRETVGLELVPQRGLQDL